MGECELYGLYFMCSEPFYLLLFSAVPRKLRGSISDLMLSEVNVCIAPTLSEPECQLTRKIITKGPGSLVYYHQNMKGREMDKRITQKEKI